MSISGTMAQTFSDASPEELLPSDQKTVMKPKTCGVGPSDGSRPMAFGVLVAALHSCDEVLAMDNCPG